MYDKLVRNFLPYLIFLVVSDASDEIGQALVEDSVDVTTHFPQRHLEAAVLEGLLNKSRVASVIRTFTFMRSTSFPFSQLKVIDPVVLRLDMK